MKHTQHIYRLGSNGYTKTLKNQEWSHREKMARTFLLLALFTTLGVLLCLMWDGRQPHIISPLSISGWTSKAYAQEASLGYDANGIRNLTEEESSDWATFIRRARALAPLYDFPVNVILSQAALESARGTSEFCRERSNCFGIGAFDRDPNLAYRYENQEQGIIEYMRLIKTRFPEAYEARKNPEQMIRLLKDNSMGRMYATDANYVAKLMSLPEWRMN